MLFGHFAMGFAAKPLAPKISLGFLLVSTQVLDILYGLFLFVGINRAGETGTNPWDHGLVMTGVWSVAGFVIAFSCSRKFRTGIIIGLLIASHWLLDFIAWDRVLPLAFSDKPLVGLGLYNSMAVMLVVDFGLLAVGVTIYLLTTKAKDRFGKWAPWLLVFYLLALLPVAILPGKLVAIASILMILTLPIGIWVDRHRSVKQLGGKKGQ